MFITSASILLIDIKLQLNWLNLWKWGVIEFIFNFFVKFLWRNRCLYEQFLRWIHTPRISFCLKSTKTISDFLSSPNSQALKKSWREQNHFLAPMADRLGKNRWNYLKFYTMIGLLLTLASRGLHFFLATRQLFTRFSVWTARLGRLNQMANFQRGQQKLHQW